MDGSDEENCFGNGGNVTSECEEYACSDGVCIQFVQVCDNLAHCHDGSDENGGCGTYSDKKSGFVLRFTLLKLFLSKIKETRREF